MRIKTAKKVADLFSLSLFGGMDLTADLPPVAPIPNPPHPTTEVTTSMVNSQVIQLNYLDSVGADDRISQQIEAVSTPQWSAPVIVKKAKQQWQGYCLNDTFPSTPKEKFKANIEAIEALKSISLASNEVISIDTKNALARYTGWGGLPNAFNEYMTAWGNEYRLLKRSLSDEQYESAKSSINNAHYTPIAVCQAIWKSIQNLGFTKGRILDPAGGTGHFIGTMPTEIANQSEITMIEIDDISSQVAKCLYPDVDVVHAGFEKTRLPNEWFDLVVGNVPFGDYKLADANYDRHNFMIHDYFIARSIDLARPGGLVVLITSTGTMDKQNESMRAYVHQRANLITAWRLPSSTFSEIAGTQASADILIFQKHQKNEKINLDSTWVSTQPLGSELISELRRDGPVGSQVHAIKLNSWFASNPEHWLGRITQDTTRYNQVIVPKVFSNAELTERLEKKVSELFAVYMPNEANQFKKNRIEKRLFGVAKGMEEGEMTISNGRIARVEDGMLVDCHDEYSGKRRARLISTLEVKLTYRELIKAMLSDAFDDNEKTAILRCRLNQKYDFFVKHHGYFNDKANRQSLKDDPSWALVLSLEVKDEDSQTIRKADVFSKRTIYPRTKVTQVATPKDAMVASLSEYGHICMPHIAQLLNCNEEQAIAGMVTDDLVFIDHRDTSIIAPRDEYLSGDVKTKLEEALLVAAKDPSFQRNVNALQIVQPADIKPGEIGIRLGQTWIPGHVYQAFIEHILQLKDIATFKFNAQSGEWMLVEGKNAGSVRLSTLSTSEWGTKDRNVFALLDHAMNQRQPSVTYTDKDGKVIKDVTKTEAARDKLEKLKTEFVKWVWSDTPRSIELSKIYNEKSNRLVDRIYDGSHLQLPGKSESITCRVHQNNAIWRIALGGNTLLAHEVGFGKTFAMQAGGMELKRIGLRNKLLYVVLNHQLEDFTAEFLRIYPAANILAARKEDLEKSRRQQFVARVVSGDWDAIVMTQSSFGKIKMLPETTERFIKEQMAMLEMAIRELDGQNDRKTIKRIERDKKALETRLTQLSASRGKDTHIYFEELGIDQLFIDEADLFKNLAYVTKMERISGMPSSASQRAFDLYMKIQHVNQMHGGREEGVVFATGTPISNSIAELYTMMRYLIPQTICKYDINLFDNWASLFAETVTALEVAPDGGGYRVNTRFAKFTNLPELMKLFRLFADIKIGSAEGVVRPDIAGGGVQTIVAQPCERQLEEVQKLVARAERIRSGLVLPTEDNMLSVTGDGRKIATDLRLLYPNTATHSGSKVELCIAKAFELWQAYAKDRAAQIIFCDMGTPNSKVFSIYHFIRSRLVELGVPSQEIAFIHEHDSDAAKASLFARVRAGLIRFLLGSTEKLGAGTNVQKRLIAIHQLDAPYVRLVVASEFSFF